MSVELTAQNQLIQKAWEDQAFREKLMQDPKAAIRELLGVVIPDHIQLKTVQETPDQLYLVIPPDPARMIPAASKPEAMW
ncbi:NHLP leader peptide family RiPP precursor [Paenibacillus sp. P96]|uniref:NHLP leader peptide family RiPP n=1 Tax=Paenibacillus zeirhizosphaerae TaxID=2987519 RepID=A0ABT9FWZ6_9BACL|nr:NHLP leader peptide family RiPP precursor [Paenibacillus sp. P96]MDP4099026.1 NHLP leader peptide family RiPP precursor [Paenibacillus sp. P96]